MRLGDPLIRLETRYHEDSETREGGHTRRLGDSQALTYTYVHRRTYAHMNFFFRIFHPEFFCDFEKKFQSTTTSRRIDWQRRVEIDVLNGNVE